MLTDFQNLLTVVFSMKCATAVMRCYISRHILKVLLHNTQKTKLAKLCYM